MKTFLINAVIVIVSILIFAVAIGLFALMLPWMDNIILHKALPFFKDYELWVNSFFQ